MKKVEALVGGLHKLAHNKELNEQGLIAIAPKLGIERQFDAVNFGEDAGLESDAQYFERIHNGLRSPESVARLEEYYEKLDPRKRQEIGRTINGVRIRQP